MPVPSEVSAAIRSFLIGRPGQHCEGCLTRGTALDAHAVGAAFRPSKLHPYSFMSATCDECGARTVCVAYVGEPNALSRERSSIAITSTMDRST